MDYHGENRIVHFNVSKRKRKTEREIERSKNPQSVHANTNTKCVYAKLINMVAIILATLCMCMCMMCGQTAKNGKLMNPCETIRWGRQEPRKKCHFAICTKNEHGLNWDDRTARWAMMTHASNPCLCMCVCEPFVLLLSQFDEKKNDK